MKKRLLLIKHMKYLWTLAVLFLSGLSSAQESENPLFSSFEEYKNKKENTSFHVKWILAGPVTNSARVEAIQGDPNNPGTMYVAFGSGNLWKTTNNGLDWKPIFENQKFDISSREPRNPYAKMGEEIPREGSLSMGALHLPI